MIAQYPFKEPLLSNVSTTLPFMVSQSASNTGGSAWQLEDWQVIKTSIEGTTSQYLQNRFVSSAADGPDT